MVAQATAQLLPHSDGVYSVQLQLLDSRQPLVINSPSLILIAEGAKGKICRALGGTYINEKSFWLNENWVFGNYTCKPDYGFSHILFEFAGRHCEDLTVSNCIFLPRQNEVNISITVRNPRLSQCYIQELIEMQADKILSVSGVKRLDNKLVWHSNHAVRIKPKTAVHSHFGKNVILIGDANGSNSPVAALGATLSTSAYSYAVCQLARELETFGPQYGTKR
jgi:2-polyprenyl-6-methoxyphenol hydroxylase-like FAD-dependent oxidoreductase